MILEICIHLKLLIKFLQILKVFINTLLQFNILLLFQCLLSIFLEFACLQILILLIKRRKIILRAERNRLRVVLIQAEPLHLLGVILDLRGRRIQDLGPESVR